MSPDIPPYLKGVLDKMRANKIAEEFAKLDIVRVARFSDKELAAWQFEHQPGTPQYILADHEWQRRLTMQQVHAAYRTAWIGVVGTLLGTLLGATLGWWLATFQPIKASSPRSGTETPRHAPATTPMPHPTFTPPAGKK
jgi:ABC-type dipeptide/oligopeptide/nickel transport system permease subunit